MTTSDARKRHVEGAFRETITEAAGLMYESLDGRWRPVADLLVSGRCDEGYALNIARNYLGLGGVA